MKLKFINKRFGSAAKEVLELSLQIMDDYSRQGYTLSLRQLYYQLGRARSKVAWERCSEKQTALEAALKKFEEGK